MHDVSISARLTTTTTKVGWWSVGDHARCIHLSTVNYNYDEGWWDGGVLELTHATMYGGVLEFMQEIISARLTTTTTKEGWWSVGDHARCIHLSTVNYNYDEGGMVECWRSCTMYPSQHG